MLDLRPSLVLLVVSASIPLDVDAGKVVRDRLESLCSKITVTQTLFNWIRTLDFLPSVTTFLKSFAMYISARVSR